MATATVKDANAKRQLEGFIAKFAPANQRLIRALRRRVRKLLPAAHELVYDNYNFLVLAYCPTEKVSDSYFSIGADKNGANLFFGYTGTKLEDPRRLLQGTGSANRFIRLASVRAFEDPDVQALVAASIALSPAMGTARGQVVIRSISPKQRPRR